MKKPSAVKVRQAVATDLSDIVRIAQAIRVDMPDFHWHKPWCVRSSIRKGEYFVALAGGRIAGIMCLSREDWVSGIDVLAVDPEYREFGIGRVLIDFAKQRAAERGCTMILVSSPELYGVKKFYLKCGFRVIDYVRIIPRLPYWSFKFPIRNQRRSR